MASHLYQLDQVIQVEKFQKIQDDIAAATDMAIITVDYKGKAITKHSSCSDFCSMVRREPTLSKQCEKCDSRGGIEAAREEQPYIYRCHLGLVDLAIPIIVDDHYLGALMAGQVILKEEANNKYLETIVSKKSQSDLKAYPGLEAAYKQLNVMTYDKIQKIAQMMNHLIHYMVEEAISKDRLNAEHRSLLEIHEAKGIDIRLLDEGKKSESSLLRPALEYIAGHLGQKVYLDDLAHICNVSPGYFSKIFKSHMGCNFSTYIKKLKMEKAKELLVSTDLPVLTIALNLGYDDPGYFIKVFKTTWGLTPAKYRKNQ